MLIDSHCHINSISEKDKDSVIADSSKGYIFVDSSIDFKSSEESVKISKECGFVYSSIGFHPFCGRSFSPETISSYDRLIDENKKVVAIGEIGLDYKSDVPLDRQKTILSEFVRLAKRRNLPLVIHNRFEGDEILTVLDGLLPDYGQVIFHCFSYSPDFLDKVLQRGAFVSFSLNILRKKDEVISSLKLCPLDRLILETDSPYMRIKNKPSAPSDIGEVYSLASSLKNIDEPRLEERVFSNCAKIFNFPEGDA